jgi:cytochrome c
MMNIFRAATELNNAQRRRIAMNRRATLMLAIGGVVGIASPSVAAGAGLHKMKSSGGTSPATPGESDGAGNMKAGLAPQFQKLKEVGPDRQVVTIQYDQDTYKVTTADGRSTEFWEANLRFKIDSSHTGPLTGKPVILPTGMMGDRASVFFASPEEMSTLIKHRADM